MPQQTKTNRTKHSRVHRVLTTRIHHNRWLFWAISSAVIILGGLFAYISIANLNDSAQQAFLNLQPHPEYSNQALGFMVDYPVGWVIDSSSTQSVTFDNPKNDGESISISEGSIASATKLKQTSSAKTQQTYTLRGNTVTLLTVTNPEGSPTKVGIVQTQTKAYFVTGSSAQFNTFLNDISPF